MAKEYIVEDIQQFTQTLRKVIFNGFSMAEESSGDKDNEDFLSLLKEQSDAEIKEMDSILSQQESLAIVYENLRKQINKTSKKVRYIVTDKMLNHIIESLNSRMVSNLLMSLSKKGIIESAYDESINDFVFWVRDENEKDKPETD